MQSRLPQLQVVVVGNKVEKVLAEVSGASWRCSWSTAGQEYGVLDVLGLLQRGMGCWCYSPCRLVPFGPELAWDDYRVSFGDALLVGGCVEKENSEWINWEATFEVDY